MLNLPKSRDGKPFISYSQYTLFNDLKSYNLGKIGFIEYFRKYFMGETYGDDKGFAGFGIKVEDALEKQDFTGFSPEEAKVLQSIEVLPVFQKELFFEVDGFFILGFIDNMTEDGSQIVDFKTASKNSVKKFYKPEYTQLDVYAAGIQRTFGDFPTSAKVKAIERKGNPFRPSTFEGFTVGGGVWEIDMDISEDKSNRILQDIADTARQISEAYTLFQKVNIKL